MSCGTSAYWNERYLNSRDSDLSWSEGLRSLSLKWIMNTVSKSSFVADIGAGRSMLLPTLLSNGYTNLTHVEWSESASKDVQIKLGEMASCISWFVGDLFEWEPDYQVDLWHDRAVFHFQVDSESLCDYMRSVHEYVRYKGYVLLATFHVDGPEKCSGLPVKRYDASTLLDALKSYDGSNWVEVKSAIWSHKTPSGIEQKFQYLLAQRC